MTKLSCISRFGQIAISTAVLLVSHSTSSIAQGSTDETMALAAPQFTSPVELQLSADGLAQARRLASMNGINPKDTYGARYEAGDYRPCEGRSYGGLPNVHLQLNGIDNSSFGQAARSKWLFDNRIVEIVTYRIHYTNARDKHPTSVQDDFACPIINENFLKLANIPAGTNVHNGLRIAIGSRALTKWTYRNRYETPVPGKGSVKVFAGTFNYTIKSAFPLLAFGEGSATVKMYLNPDTGRWTMENFQMTDPGFSVKTDPLPSNPLLVSLRSVQVSSPPPAPRTPVFTKQGKDDNDRRNDASVCGMAQINGQLKGQTWIDCMVQKGWQVRWQGPVSGEPVSPAQQGDASHPGQQPDPSGCMVVIWRMGFSRIVSPYKGGCKDGRADGPGTYSAVMEDSPDGSNVSTVKGHFREGRLNGHVTINGPNAAIQGEYRDNQPLNAKFRGVVKGIQIYAEYRNGAPFVVCKSDGKDEINCTDRDKLLGTR